MFVPWQTMVAHRPLPFSDFFPPAGTDISARNMPVQLAGQSVLAFFFFCFSPGEHQEQCTAAAGWARGHCERRGRPTWVATSRLDIYRSGGQRPYTRHCQTLQGKYCTLAFWFWIVYIFYMFEERECIISSTFIVGILTIKKVHTSLRVYWIITVNAWD